MLQGNGGDKTRRPEACDANDIQQRRYEVFGDAYGNGDENGRGDYRIDDAWDAEVEEVEEGLPVEGEGVEGPGGVWDIAKGEDDEEELPKATNRLEHGADHAASLVGAVGLAPGADIGDDAADSRAEDHEGNAAGGEADV